MGHMGRLAPTGHNLLTAWQWSPFSIAVLLAAVALAVVYLQGDWRLATRGRRWPVPRTVAFLGGLVAVDIALQSPVSAFTNWYFQAHIVQHLLLMVVGPPLLALGAPSTLLLQASSRRAQTRWLAVLRSRPFRALTHPLVVWTLYFGAMFAFFLSSLINYAMEHMAVMDGINLVFLMGGCLYWWPMVGLDPIVHWRMGYGVRVANLILAVPFEAFLGIAIMYEHSPIASMYTLQSTHAGGALLWGTTELATFIGLVPIFVQWSRSEDRAGARADSRSASRLDQAVDGETALNHALAALAPKGRSSVPSQNGALVLTGTSAASPSGSAVAAPRPVATNRFKPLFQPGNAAWEAMWRAKAGRAPSVATKRNSPPGTPGLPSGQGEGSRP